MEDFSHLKYNNSFYFNSSPITFLPEENHYLIQENASFIHNVPGTVVEFPKTNEISPNETRETNTSDLLVLLKKIKGNIQP